MSEQATTIGDANVARLVARAGEPVAPDPAFAARVTERLRADARARRADARAAAASWRALLAAGLSGAALSVALLTSAVLLSRPEAPAPAQPAPVAVPAPTPRVAPQAEPATPTSATPEVAPPEVAPPELPPPAVAPSQAPPPEVPPPGEDPGVTAQGPPAPPAAPTAASLLAEAGQLQPRPRPAPLPCPRASAGQTIATGPRERRRLALDDGSTLDVDAATRVVLLAERRVRVEAGRVAVDVAPRGPQDPFVVEAEGRTLTALGTRFVVAAGAAPELLVAHGRVRVGGPGPALDVQAGWRADLATGSTAPLGPASRALSWTRDLAVAAESPLVVGASGPALLVRDAAGQEASLPLRRTSVDVVVEDGFARTAIDLTFFNRTWQRLEGTFRLPLPAGASISRLAMYCEGKLMEGACVERERARTVFETIRHQRRDPALLEWLDGSVFKLRVFPIEPRQEKRVVLCYTQRLDVRPEGTTYRLLGGGPARPDRFSVRARIRGGARRAWDSRTHELAARTDGEDLVLEHLSLDASALGGTAGDLVLDLGPEAAATSLVSGAGAADVVDVGGWRYLAVRARCDLPVAPRPARRAWVVAVETSADRDPLLARTALDAARGLLAQAGPDDLFALLSASTRTTLVSGLGPVTPAAIEAALASLERAHLVGALDLGAELEACAGPLAAARAAGAEPWLVQLGTALPVLGERDPDALLARLPAGARVLGVGVGRRWNRGWLRRAAARTGGHVDQLHPDEPIGWRASEIASALDAPRLLDLKVEGAGVELLVDRPALLAGDELLALARLKPGQAPPAEVVVTGQVGGAAVRYPVRLGVPRQGASHLARTWGRLEVERLLASGGDPEAIRREVVALGTSLNLITPFTSLLVLENEAMHRQFNVPLGTREHWAPYDLPASLPVVTEADRTTPAPGARRPRAEVLASIFRRRTAAGVPILTNVPLIGGLFVSTRSFRFDTEVERRKDTGFGRQIPAQGNARASRLGPIVGPAGGQQTLFGSSLFGGRTENILNGGSAYFGGDRLTETTPPEGPPTSAIFQRSMRRLEATDYFYRTREVPLGDDGNPDYEDDEDERDTVVGFDRPTDENPIAAGENLVGGRGLRPMRIDVDFEGEDLANAMEAIGRSVGRNILVDPNVRETIRVSLRDIPWRDAVDVIARMTRAQVEERAGGIVVLTRPRGRTTSDERRASDECYLSALAGGDLLPLAPGFATSAEDYQAVLDAEAIDDEPRTGRIDEAARRLLERARRAAWERVELPGGAVVRHEGGGRFVLERRLEARLGLVERVASDGVRLTHQYPELGLASSRRQGAAYRELLRSFVPWALPAPEELARDADLLAEGATVRVVPHDARLAVEELVLEGDRLVERRLVRTGQLLSRERYLRTPTGVEVVRQEGVAAPSTRALVAAPCAAPTLQELQPSSDLVVLPLPWRRVTSPAGEGLDDAWLASAFARLDHAGVLQHVERLLERGDRRLGWYTLLAASPQWYLSSQEARRLLEGPMWPHLPGQSGATPIQRVGPTVDAPAAWFAARQSALDAVGGVPPAELPGAAPGSFFARVALLRHAAALCEGPAGVDGARAALERLVDDPALRPFAVGLLSRVVEATHGDVVDARLDALLADCTGREQPAEVALTAHHLRLRLALARGDAASAKARAIEQVRAAADRACSPLLTEGLLGSLADEARGLLDVARAMVRADRRREAERLAEGLESFGALAGGLAAEVRLVSRDGASPDALRELALLEALGASDERLVELLGVSPSWTDRPEQAALLLRAAAAAARLGRTGKAAAFAERAMALEDASGDELVDLVDLRARTGALLGWLRNQVEAYQRLDQPLPADLAPRVVRAVDRLRAVDGPGADQACREAAHLLGELREPALAWDYLVSPVALAPDEAPRWADLAQALTAQGHHQQADEALARACAVEPTNADLLLQRAQALLGRGERTRARPLLERLVKESWQPRFAGAVQYARQLLQN